MPPARVAQYLRMSTEHQRYSPEHQAVAIAAYALGRGYEIVRTYRDDGISGLSIRNRAGLKGLLSDVVSGTADFEAILVYDVSRWGRFQNPDQSAHYEFLCAEAGVRVEYCAEPFENDGSAASTIIKAVKRVMAAEYSRELSKKVAASQRRMAAMGYWQGGPPGYGYRRMAIDAAGRPVARLSTGEFKAVQAHRTVLVEGPAEEIATVRRIFWAFGWAGLSQEAIVRQLNAEGLVGESGAPWTYTRLHRLLRNPIYVGDMAIQKTSGGALTPRLARPRSEWILVKGACPALVDRKAFRAAQARFEREYQRRSNEALLDLLRKLYAQNDGLTYRRIRATPWVPDPSLYERRFGSVRAACEAAGLPYAHRQSPWRRWRDRGEVARLLAELYQREGYLTFKLIADQPNMPHPSTYRQVYGSLTNAYAAVGYMPKHSSGRSSRVTQARREAARLRTLTALRGPTAGASPG